MSSGVRPVAGEAAGAALEGGKPYFERVAFIGVGLIGSSMARVMRRDGLAGTIVACARSQETLDTCKRLGLAEVFELDAAAAVKDADLVVLAVPVGANETVGRAIGPHLKPGCIVTDVGSVKQAVIRDIGPFLPEGVDFVPGHPIAGTEHSGPEAGFAELFEDRWCLLTPPPGTSEAAVERIAALWRAFGSHIEVMDAGHHDKVLAVTSHLPHLIAFTIVGTASDLEESTQAEVIKFSAGGFRDFTRVAASDPVMWRDVFLNNREAVLEILQRFSEDLTALQRAIRWGEGEQLESLFRRTRAIRRQVVDAGQAGTFDSREPDKAGTAPPDPDKGGRPGE